MKRLILFVTLVLGICVSAYSQNENAIENNDLPATEQMQAQISDTVNLTTAMLYKDFKNAISEIAIAMKTPAENVYNTLIKQQRVEAVSYLCIFVILLIISISLLYLEGSGKVNAGAILIIIGVVLFVVDILFLLIVMNYIATGLFNPEFGAIDYIARFIKY